MVVVGADELVEIARNGGHGMVRSRNTEVLNLGNSRWKN
jgi:hypothetical protein